MKATKKSQTCSKAIDAVRPLISKGMYSGFTDGTGKQYFAGRT